MVSPNLSVSLSEAYFLDGGPRGGGTGCDCGASSYFITDRYAAGKGVCYHLFGAIKDFIIDKAIPKASPVLTIKSFLQVLFNKELSGDKKIAMIFLMQAFIPLLGALGTLAVTGGPIGITILAVVLILVFTVIMNMMLEAIEMTFNYISSELYLFTRLFYPVLNGRIG